MVVVAWPFVGCNGATLSDERALDIGIAISGLSFGDRPATAVAALDVGLLPIGVVMRWKGVVPSLPCKVSDFDNKFGGLVKLWTDL